MLKPNVLVIKTDSVVLDLTEGREFCHHKIGSISFEIVLTIKNERLLCLDVRSIEAIIPLMLGRIT